MLSSSRGDCTPCWFPERGFLSECLWSWHCTCFPESCHLTSFPQSCHFACFPQSCHFTCFLQSCHPTCFLHPFSHDCHVTCLLQSCQLRLFSSVMLLHLLSSVMIVTSSVFLSHVTSLHSLSLSLFTNFSGLVNKLQWQRGSAPLLSITGQPCHGVLLSPGHCSSPGSPSASEGSRDTVRGSWETKQRGSLHNGIGKEDCWWQQWEWDTCRSQLPISIHGEGGLQDSEASFCSIFPIHINYTVATIIVYFAGHYTLHGSVQKQRQNTAMWNSGAKLSGDWTLCTTSTSKHHLLWMTSLVEGKGWVLKLFVV